MNPFANISTVPAVVVALLMIAFGVVYLVYLKRGKRETPELIQAAEMKPPEQTTVTSVPAKEPVTVLPKQKLPTEQFCINCGSKLPTGSQFCNNCGAKQGKPSG